MFPVSLSVRFGWEKSVWEETERSRGHHVLLVLTVTCFLRRKTSLEDPRSVQLVDGRSH